MRYALYCNTQYQVFAAECFLLNHCDRDADTCDIYIDIDNAEGMEACAQKLEKQHLFSRVYKVRRIMNAEKGCRLYAHKVQSYLNPRKIFEKSVVQSGLKGTDAYDYVMISHLGPLARWFVFSFPEAQVCFFEDGLGSYLNDTQEMFVTRKDRFFEKLTKRGPGTIRPVCFYLFCPEFYNGRYDALKRKITVVDETQKENAEKLEEIFPRTGSTVYGDYKYIYLDQPVATLNKALTGCQEQISQEMDSLLNRKLGEKVLVRPHPRQKKKDYQRMRADRAGESWEISCTPGLRDDCVLIGRYSTAQFTPKLLYNKEPYLIFTHRLFPEDGKGVSYADAGETIERLKKLYVSENRIFCPENFQELEELLDSME